LLIKGARVADPYGRMENGHLEGKITPVLN
jgi:hypothetical protein